MYGLPRQCDEEIAEWEQALGYLRAICDSREAVRVMMMSSTEQCYLEARGVLIDHSSEHPPRGPLFEFDPTDRKGGGFLRLSAEQFKGGRLTSDDGNTYFSLAIRLDGSKLVFLDTNAL